MTLETDSLGMTVIMREDYYPLVVQDAEVDLVNDPERYKINRNLGNAADNVFSSTDERNGFEVNLQGSYMIGDFSATTKVGGHFDFREKEFLRDFNRFSTVEVSPLPELRLSDSVFGGGTRVPEYFPDRPEYNFGPNFDTVATNSFFDDPGEVVFVEEPNDITYNVTDAILKNYLADEDVLAGYIMQTLEKGSLKIIAGLRLEETRNSFTNTEILTRPEGLPVSFVSPGFWNRLPLDAFSQQTTSERTYNHVLPALHVRKELGEKTVVRASYTETIARPKFTDLVPREIISINGSQFGNSVDLPNFDLAPMESTNIDFSIEHYFKGLGLVSVSPFYKKLTGPIYLERRTVDSGTELSGELAAKYNSLGRDTTDWETNQWKNAGDGKILGVEVAFERKLNFLPEPFDGFGVSFNTAFIDSEVQLLLEERFEEEVPMFKQSSNMGNVSLFYEKFGLLVRLAMVWRGEYLEGVRGGRTNITDLTVRHELPADSLDVYVDDFKKLDLTIKYRFRDHFSVFVEATNLTDEPLRRYEGDTSRLHSIQFTGPIYSIGAKWNL
jgi:TonB-dependent receptor